MDLRTQKTKQALTDSFLYFLKKKNLNQITVAEITRKANIGRGTFYLHYKDVFDLYDEIGNQLYFEMETFFDKAYPSTDSTNLMNLTNALTEYIEHKRELFLLLNKPEDNGQTFNKFKTLFTEKVLLEAPELYTSEYDEVESMFIVSGVIGVLEEWLLSGLVIPQKKLADYLHQVIKMFNPDKTLAQTKKYK